MKKLYFGDTSYLYSVWIPYIEPRRRRSRAARPGRRRAVHRRRRRLPVTPPLPEPSRRSRPSRSTPSSTSRNGTTRRRIGHILPVFFLLPYSLKKMILSSSKRSCRCNPKCPIILFLISFFIIGLNFGLLSGNPDRSTRSRRRRMNLRLCEPPRSRSSKTRRRMGPRTRGRRTTRSRPSRRADPRSRAGGTRAPGSAAAAAALAGKIRVGHLGVRVIRVNA